MQQIAQTDRTYTTQLQIVAEDRSTNRQLP